MKVLQLQYQSSLSGDFAYRLHEAFMEAGIESSILALLSDVPSSPERRHLGRRARLTAKLDSNLQAYIMRNRNTDLGNFSYPILGTNISVHEQVQAADIIYVHWVLNGFLNLKQLEQLAKLGKPIVFVLHDMWSITGGCHYAFDCEKYLDQCANCPIFYGNRQRDLAYSGFQKKAKFYRKYDNLYFVSPSSWLYECAKQSALTKDQAIFHIPNVLNRDKFKPIDKLVARQVLNIDPGKKVIAFGAVSISSPYKGWAYLKKALQLYRQQISRQDISVLVFGNGNQQEISDSIPFETRFLGRISDEYAMTLVYNAADLFIAPSLADNLPYVIFEALACGAPVVAFDTGGIPDLIMHKSNGYLAEYRNVEDLVRGIDFCLENEIIGKVPPALANELTIDKHRQLFAHVQNSRPYEVTSS